MLSAGGRAYDTMIRVQTPARLVTPPLSLDTTVYVRLHTTVLLHTCALLYSHLHATQGRIGNPSMILTADILILRYYEYEYEVIVL